MYNKYFKYKYKYLQLKQLIGGLTIEDLKIKYKNDRLIDILSIENTIESIDLILSQLIEHNYNINDSLIDIIHIYCNNPELQQFIQYKELDIKNLFNLLKIYS